MTPMTDKELTLEQALHVEWRWTIVHGTDLRPYPAWYLIRRHDEGLVAKISYSFYAPDIVVFFPLFDGRFQFSRTESVLTLKARIEDTYTSAIRALCSAFPGKG